MFKEYFLQTWQMEHYDNIARTKTKTVQETREQDTTNTIFFIF